jgi:hypothetical protein
MYSGHLAFSNQIATQRVTRSMQRDFDEPNVELPKHSSVKSKRPSKSTIDTGDYEEYESGAAKYDKAKGKNSFKTILTTIRSIFSKGLKYLKFVKIIPILLIVLSICLYSVYNSVAFHLKVLATAKDVMFYNRFLSIYPLNREMHFYVMKSYTKNEIVNNKPLLVAKILEECVDERYKLTGFASSFECVSDEQANVLPHRYHIVVSEFVNISTSHRHIISPVIFPLEKCPDFEKYSYSELEKNDIDQLYHDQIPKEFETIDSLEIKYHKLRDDISYRDIVDGRLSDEKYKSYTYNTKRAKHVCVLFTNIDNEIEKRVYSNAVSSYIQMIDDFYKSRK